MKIMLREEEKSWWLMKIQGTAQNVKSVPVPLAAPDRSSTPDLSLLAQLRGRFPTLTCKVHRGKGLSGRRLSALDRLIKRQVPFPSTEGSRFGLIVLTLNRDCGGLEKWLNL